jgi:DNA-binding MarR family transcriptional regulator
LRLIMPANVVRQQRIPRSTDLGTSRVMRPYTETSPYAWQRLNRFAAAVGYQTLSEAAEHLGVAQSALVIQINRLERDIGGSLLERAERGRPMTPTALGEQVLAALHRTSQPGG